MRKVSVVDSSGKQSLLQKNVYLILTFVALQTAGGERKRLKVEMYYIITTSFVRRRPIFIQKIVDKKIWFIPEILLFCHHLIVQGVIAAHYLYSNATTSS